MMDEKIIEQIIRRIMSDPSLTALLSGNAAQQTDACGRALILVNYSPDVEERLNLLADSWKQAYALDAVLSPGAQAAGIKLPAGINQVEGNAAFQAMSQWNRVVIPALSQNTLAKLATGIRDGALLELAAKAIEAGMKIDVVPGFCLPATAPAAWSAMYEGYLKVLQSFHVCVHNQIQGVIACPSCDQPGSCEFSSLTAPGSSIVKVAEPKAEKPKDALKTPVIATMNQKLYECTTQVLTERDVMGFERKSVVKLAKRTIITPLAKERLGERQIDYFREGE